MKHIAQHSSHHRLQALDLLARCGLLRTILGWHVIGDTATIALAKESLALAKENYEASGDPALLLSAYSKLAWAYSYKNEDDDALQIAIMGEQFLIQQDPAKVPANVRGGTYSTLALMQARTEQSPDEALGKATEHDPGTDEIAFLSFTRDDIPLESGLILYHAGDQTGALNALRKIVDSNTLELTSPYCLSERGRLSAINAMVQSCIATPSRDKEQITHYWRAISDGARTLQSEWLLNKARGLYRDMKNAFPGERDILALRDSLVHVDFPTDRLLVWNRVGGSRVG